MYASYSLRMEGEAVQQSAVHGHHIYKKVWRPDIGQELPVLPEPNCHDRQVVPIYDPHSHSAIIFACLF